ncbi:MAG: CehA/McbA family metallohydrolase [Myxococcota bacterium]
MPRPHRPALYATAALALLSTLWSMGCTREGCLASEEGCVVPPPCPALPVPTCDDPSVFVEVLRAGDTAPDGLEAFGATGDLLLGNSRVRAVIDAVENENYVGMSGGFLLDLSTTGDNNDSLNQIVHAVGFLPEDTVVYTRMETLTGDGFAAVQVHGHLAGDARHRVHTRYEVRPCEPGVRVRTEMVHEGDEDVVWANVDGYWWGGRQNWGFSPLPGVGFDQPAFGLSTVNDVFQRLPFLAGASFVEPAASYATVSCSTDTLEGFQSETVSAAGGPRRVVRPGDYLVHERIHLVGKGRGIQPAADLALEVRAQLFEEAHATLSGAISLTPDDGVAIGERALVLISEGRTTDPPELRTPWTLAVPDDDGRFHAELPADREYLVEVYRFGKVAATRSVSLGRVPIDLGDLPVAAGSQLRTVVRLDGQETDALVWLLPVDDEDVSDYAARFLGALGASCAPLLAYPYGPSPACNRFLTREQASVEIPPGRFELYASKGPFVTIARQMVDVPAGGSAEVVVDLTSLDVLPSGVLSADFHVHGSKSFDTMLPDVTRVRSLLAAGLDVIAATEHDAVGDFSAAAAQLGITDEVIIIPGLEATTFVLWNFNPAVTYPQVIGHWNFWPLQYRPDAPRDGAPSDERAEPAQLFTRVKQAELPEWGVAQLNHPYSENQFGRDYGYVDALGLDLREPLPLYDDGSPAALFHRQPAGSAYRNSDFHTQEVMTSTRNDFLQANRAFWFYLLNQGFLRAGTANSDSHTLTDSLVGLPRTLVFTDTTRRAFDVETFQGDVRAGHMVGTNGPVIEARLIAPDGSFYRPALHPLRPVEGMELSIQVRAAPWVYVDEIRVVVNGEVAHRSIDVVNGADPFAEEPVLRTEQRLPLEELLPANGTDAWLVVEAGVALPISADLDCDGAPDTGDNNGDGTVDWRDADRNADGDVNETDLDLDRDGALDARPADCTYAVGPLRNPSAPARDSERFPYFAVTDGTYPMAFTNPFVVDRAGDGFDPPGLP